MTNWHFQSATDQARAIKNKDISAVELLEIYEKRVNQYNAELNALVATNFETAKKKAIEADRLLAEGRELGPLHGIPISIKDNLEAIGFPCTAGAKDFIKHVPSRNADVVQSLVDAGAIVLGKSNLPMFAQDFQTYNDLFSQTNNPWDTSRTPGGSSGGSAVSIAAGLSSLELGNDIGGSLRIPAHFNGIYAHKPSFGIVPSRGMVPPAPGIFTGDYVFNMDIVCNGPLARSPEDLDLMMDLIVQPEASERKAWSINLPPAKKRKLSDYKVGFWLNDEEYPVDQSIIACIKKVIDSLSNHGVAIEEKHPNVLFGRSFDLFANLLNGVLGQAAPGNVFRSWIEKEPQLDKTAKDYQTKQMRGAIQRHRDWLMKDAERQIIRQKWQEFFDDFDILICPVAPVTAFLHDHGPWFSRTLTVNGKEVPYANIMSWAGLINGIYLPATIVPLGLTEEGLPCGIQLVGSYLNDKTCIQFAVLLKDLLGGFSPPPNYK